MNTARIAQLLRALAAEFDELAIADTGAVAPLLKRRAPPKRRRRVVTPPPLDHPPSELDIARARAAAKRAGIVVG